MKLKSALTIILFSIAANTSLAQTTEVKDKKFYIGNTLDGAIFSTSLLQKPSKSQYLSTLRFSTFLHFGFNFYYDVSRDFSVFTGLGIKNIGFIEKFSANDSTVKRRVYTLGAPFGFKVGNLVKRKFFLAGGGLDLALNYREKGFVKRGDKDKFNEWFSDRTPLVMPYIFAGYSFDPGMVVKLQYYPGNFLNTGFTEGGLKPYAGYKVNLLMLTLGLDIHYNKKPHEGPKIYMM
jgi:hypothetical protein